MPYPASKPALKLQEYDTALTKNDILEEIQVVGFTKKTATGAVESLLEIIKQTLEAEDDILVSGFGKFCVKEKRPGRERNPALKADMNLWGRRIVTFKRSGKLREKINGE